MSIRIALDELVGEVERWPFAYLVTVSDDGRPHAVALRPSATVVEGRTLLGFEAGDGRAARNAAARPEVTLLFPPAGHSDGFSLVVDGRASVVDGTVAVEPTSAVLHRPAP